MIFKRGEKLYTIPESEMVDALIREIDLWEDEERAAGRLAAGTPTIKAPVHKDDHHEVVAGKIRLPILT